MALTSKQRQMRRDLIEQIAAAHPGRPYDLAVTEGAAAFARVLDGVQAEAGLPQEPASAEELAAMDPDEFSAAFGARLGELGRDASLSSPFWAR